MQSVSMRHYYFCLWGELILPMVKNAGSRTLQEATATLEPDPFPTLGLI